MADPGDHQVPSTLEGHSFTITEAAAAAGDKPLFLTEYAIGNHDSVTAAAGILTYVPRLSGVLPLMSYWAFSVRRSAPRQLRSAELLRAWLCVSQDVFEEHGIEAVPFHNEWGLVNICQSSNGRPRPSHAVD